MISAKQTIDSLVPITMFNRGKASIIFDKLQEVKQLFVLKNNKPEAVIISPEEFTRLSEIEENYALLTEALERSSADTGIRYTADEVLQMHGIRMDELSDVEEPDIE